MRRTLCLPIVCLVIALVGQAAAAEATFLTLGHPDLTKLLASPPAPTSAEQSGDLAGILAIQKTRTKTQTDRALADDTAGTFGFADVLGPSFSAERLPKVAALFEKIRGDAVVVANAGKDTWNRPRPYTVSTAIEPVGEKPSGSSYPSTSSVVGSLTAIMLSNMVPEKSAALYARGREFGDDRIILGVHFPTDIEAGRLAGTVIAAALWENAAFQTEFAAAKTELRQALGLQPDERVTDR
jgi:acid phosphatase (class A)